MHKFSHYLLSHIFTHQKTIFIFLLDYRRISIKCREKMRKLVNALHHLLSIGDFFFCIAVETFSQEKLLYWAKNGI